MCFISRQKTITNEELCKRSCTKVLLRFPNCFHRFCRTQLMRYGPLFLVRTEESVQLTNIPEYEELQNAELLEKKWAAFLQLRDEVLKALEEARNEKVIGKSLAAKVTLYVDAETKNLLASLEESMKQLFIVSDFEVAGSIEEAPDHALKLDHAAILVEKADGETCERCWIVTPEIGKNSEHPTLCSRCADVVKENY